MERQREAAIIKALENEGQVTQLQSQLREVEHVSAQMTQMQKQMHEQCKDVTAARGAAAQEKEDKDTAQKALDEYKKAISQTLQKVKSDSISREKRHRDELEKARMNSSRPSGLTAEQREALIENEETLACTLAALAECRAELEKTKNEAVKRSQEKVGEKPTSNRSSPADDIWKEK